MPRVTYADRFIALLARPLNKRDRQFCESLQSFYLRKGRLTAGRVRCVKQLEERYSAEKMAEAAERGGPMLKRLSALLTRVEGNQWASGFVMSLSQQVQGGRDLSDKQVTILEKIERENSDSAIAAKKTWHLDYDAEKRERAMVAARYYRETSNYYRDLVDKILDNPEFVPSPRQYKSITENKYAQKVLDAHYDAPKYAVGSFVAMRSSAPWACRSGAGNKPCVVIQTNAAPIISAARGVKRYKVLPIGSARPIIVEERHLKSARGLK